MLFCKRCVFPGSNFVHNHDLDTQGRYAAAAAPIQGSGPNICRGVVTRKKSLILFNSTVVEVTALAAPGVPFSLSAVPALEAVAGVEELSLPDTLLQQVYCSWHHSTACIVVLLEICSSPQRVCQPSHYTQLVRHVQDQSLLHLQSWCMCASFSNESPTHFGVQMFADDTHIA